MAPDIAIVGEVRDREALPLLLTLSSGVKGYTTIHAGSARQALARLRFVCQLNEVGAAIPPAALNALVSESIDVVVHCRRTDAGPRVSEIIAIEEQQSGTDSGVFTITALFETVDGTLRATGNIPTRLARQHVESGGDIVSVLRRATEEN
jgi:pilus assembly protein CpaF